MLLIICLRCHVVPTAKIWKRRRKDCKEDCVLWKWDWRSWIKYIYPIRHSGQQHLSRCTDNQYWYHHAKCATCKKSLTSGNLQASTQGPYRTIQQNWIIRTFFFCPRRNCISGMPRNSYIRPYQPSTMPITFDSSVTLEQRNSIDITIWQPYHLWFLHFCILLQYEANDQWWKCCC